MIDLETLDVTPTATILTIGAQGFDPFSSRLTDVTFYKRLTLESQADRTINESTVEWWSKQNEAAQEEALGDGDDRIDITTALDELAKIAWKHDRIWANGICFDITMLENAMVQYGVNVPWKFWQVNDARTVYKIAKAGTAGASNSHNALEDCVNQIDMLQRVFRDLGITSF
jgi:hypothetical protein